MLHDDVIEPSRAAWSSPIVIVKKKDGGKRFCVDYRKLNHFTVKDSYPLPKIDEAIDSLSGSAYFCTLDLASGYWQVPMDDDSMDKTTFCCRKGLFRYKVMPFGLCNAPATFERLMEVLLAGLNWKRCLIYIDDLLIFGATYQACLANLQEVLSKLKEANLKVKPKKCFLFQEEVAYLGHIVSRHGVKPNPDNTARVRLWPAPTTVKDVRQFLGLCSYYRRWIPGFATIAAPLHNLTKKEVPFTWCNQCEAAMQQLKDLLCDAPILAYPNRYGTFVLDTDASNFGIGAVLSQNQGKTERPISYASRSLSRTQRAYCTTHRELLAVYKFLKYFRHYLANTKFIIRTDHASLTWLMNFKDPEHMMARWISVIDTYDKVLEHRAGKKHGNADALSRVTVRRRCNQAFCSDCKGIPPPTKTDSRPMMNAVITRGQRMAVKPSSSEPHVEENEPTQAVEVTTQTTTVMSRDSASENVPTQTPRQPTMQHGSASKTPLDHNYRQTTLQQGSASNSATTSSETMQHGTSCDLPTTDLGSVAPNTSNCKGTVTDVADDLSVPSLESIGVHQAADMTTQTMRRLMETYGELKPPEAVRRRQTKEVRQLCSEWKKLKLINGLLYRSSSCVPMSPGKLQLYVPVPARRAIFHQLHATRTAGHFAHSRTTKHVQHRFYWPGYKSDTKRWTRECFTCQRRKAGPGQAKMPLEQVPCTFPNERWHIDILTVKPVSNQGNSLIMVVVDAYTRWTEALPIPDHKAITVADALVTKVMTRLGCPYTLHSDQGPDFTSELFTEVCKLLDVYKTRTSPYRPQSDGQPERFNRTLLAMLSMFVDEYGQTWEDHLPYVMMAYRSSIHDTTGLSPNMLMLAREVNLPLDLTMGPPPDQAGTVCRVTYVEWMREAISHAHNFVVEKLRSSLGHQKSCYDVSARPRRPHLGQWVWMFSHAKANRKLELPWVGPSLVVAKTKNHVNVVIQKDKNARLKTVHVNYLKPVIGTPPQESWLTKSDQCEVSTQTLIADQVGVDKPEVYEHQPAVTVSERKAKGSSKSNAKKGKTMAKKPSAVNPELSSGTKVAQGVPKHTPLDALLAIYGTDSDSSDPEWEDVDLDEPAKVPPDTTTDMQHVTNCPVTILPQATAKPLQERTLPVDASVQHFEPTKRKTPTSRPATAAKAKRPRKKKTQDSAPDPAPPIKKSRGKTKKTPIAEPLPVQPVSYSRYGRARLKPLYDADDEWEPETQIQNAKLS